MAGFTNFTRVKELYEQAQAIDPARRDAWIQSVCTGDPQLLAELRAMFEVNQQETAAHIPHAAPPPAQSIGPYRLSRELGRGGMGVVYLAMRDDGAFRKNVALKLLLQDQVSPEFILRFKQERQVVAALDHPNIARILDGGETVNGMPYYVMEYVEGIPLDKYCDQQRLSLTGRIKLFQQVCNAVHYLHLNLIVHRDLKPNNILVSTEGAIKLLDFGIAKVVGAASLAANELTSAQGVPMTPAYASPEQIQGATLQKTSDIYSLGVILYLLLTGRQPYEGIDDKIAKLASGKDPALPSANIREDLRVSPESTAQLRRALMGGLDSIVLMAMRYNLKDRYQSAADLANDLQSFLDGQAVTAYHDSVAGRSMKLLKRKRAAVAVVAGFLVVGGFGVWQLQRVEAQKAEIAIRQQQLRALLEQVESKAGSTDPAAAADRLQDVRQVKKAFATDFTAVLAHDTAPSRERDALLDRGIRYFDRIRAASASNAQLGLEVADGYQQLGLLQEKTSRADAKNREVAVSTYRKAAGVLNDVFAGSPGNTDAQRRLAQVNDRIRTLSGSNPTVASNTPPYVDPPAPSPVLKQAPQAPAQRRTRAAAPLSEVATGGAAPSGVVADDPPTAPKISPADKADLEERLINAEAKVASAEQSIEPVKQKLEQKGEALNANDLSALVRMRSSLERARRDVAEGNVAQAKDALAAADGIANRLLRSVNR